MTIMLYREFYIKEAYTCTRILWDVFDFKIVIICVFSPQTPSIFNYIPVPPKNHFLSISSRKLDTVIEELLKSIQGKNFLLSSCIDMLALFPQLGIKIPCMDF